MKSGDTPSSAIVGRATIRGNNSVVDCNFAKLKLKFKSASLNNTLLKDHPEIKIGTHCGDDASTPRYRLKQENATWRQAGTGSSTAGGDRKSAQSDGDLQ